MMFVVLVGSPFITRKLVVSTRWRTFGPFDTSEAAAEYARQAKAQGADQLMDLFVKVCPVESAT